MVVDETWRDKREMTDEQRAAAGQERRFGSDGGFPMTHFLCWHDHHGSTRRATMSAPAAERFAQFLNAVFRRSFWTEAAPIQGDEACPA